MPDKCLECPAPSADMDGFIVSGPGGAPRSEGSGVSGSEGPFAKEAPQTGHVVIMGTLGADGNPGVLPDVPQVGWAYVAEDAGTYGGVSATEGDIVYCMSLNPARWGVLQADSDDAGQSLVGVSAEVSCAGWRTAEDAGLLGACCLRQDDDSGTCYGPDSASLEEGVLTVVWKTRWEARWLDADVRFASGEGHVRVDMSQIRSLVHDEEEYGIDDGRQCPPGGCVWNFEDVRARAALESFSGEPDPYDPQYGRIITAVFHLEERPASSLDVYARAADGTVSKSSSALPCLDAALVSAKADASCGGRVVPAESAKFYITFYDGEANFSEDLDARSGSFVLSGAHVDWAASSYSSSSYVRLSFSVPGEDEDVFLSEYANSFARVFNGTLQPGAFIPMSGGSGSYGLVLAERTELTSEDEGGPDVLVRFQIVDAGGGPSVAVVAETLGGDVSVDTADLSCLVPPVFSGPANGLVPASGAVQNYLLAGNGTWMRPMTDAEIDALFV